MCLFVVTDPRWMPLDLFWNPSLFVVCVTPSCPLLPLFVFEAARLRPFPVSPASLSCFLLVVRRGEDANETFVRPPFVFALSYNFVH